MNTKAHSIENVVDIVDELDDLNSMLHKSRIALGRLAEPMKISGLEEGSWILFDPTLAEAARFQMQSIIEIPGLLDQTRAALVPYLYFAVSLWDQLRLEIGENAIVSGNSTISKVLYQVALWQGAWPAILVQGPTPASPAFQELKVDMDLQENDEQPLRKFFSSSTGFAAVDASGKSEVIDFIFEMMPQWGRMAFCHPKTASLTLDYYNNIHRKGAWVLSSLLTSNLLFHSNSIPYFRQLMERSIRLADSCLVEGILSVL